jgi:outer membrane protein assembly factor BamD (BamD/ComL family)
MENPEQTAPEQTPVEPTGLNALPDSVKEQWKSLAIKAGLAVVVVLSVFLYREHKQSNEAQASRMLGEARNVPALQAIITQYPGSPAARLALLQTAKALYDSGDYMAAAAAYAEFGTKYPKHPMVAVAHLGKIACTEATGQFPEALAAYSTFLKEQPDSFLTPSALFGKARCLEQMQKPGEARAVYEDFLTANPKSMWKSDVEENLRQLDRNSRRSNATR